MLSLKLYSRSVDSAVFFLELFPRLFAVRIGDTGLNRTYLGTLRFVVISNALGANIRIDNKALFPFADCVIRAHWLAGSTVDALIIDH